MNALIALVLMQFAPQLPDIPPDAKVTQPEWLQRPSAEILQSNYPKEALAHNLAGSVVISCMITAAGTLSPCEVIAEAPIGAGFGDAALTTAKVFRMRPMTVNGKPVGGPVVEIPLSFSTGSPPGWPAAAWLAKAEGHVLLNCTLNDNLNPVDCSVETETPPGLDFGSFAKVRVRLQRFETKPDGQRLHPGDHVHVPVAFPLPVRGMAATKTGTPALHASPN